MLLFSVYKWIFKLIIKMKIWSVTLLVFFAFVDKNLSHDDC